MGLLIVGIFGTIPTFFDNYLLILGSRMLVGVGLGFINSKAITIIGHRYTGEERRKLLGIRSAVEPLGSSIMAMLVAQLLVFEWRYAYLVYSISFVLLFMYLLFVPNDEIKNEQNKEENTKLNKRELFFTLKHSIIGMILVSTAVMLAIKIPLLVLKNSLGTPAFGNVLLSLTLFAGFLSGFTFNSLFKLFKKCFLPFF